VKEFDRMSVQTGRVVSADEARRVLDGDPLGRGLITNLAHTVVTQAGQIAAACEYLTDALAFEERVNERKGGDDERARAVISALVGALDALGVSGE
jgi:hypothetical protein